MQIQLKPALRRLWREPGTLQIGLSGRGAVLSGVTPADVELLEDLQHGVDPRRLSTSGRARDGELVRLLADAGLLLRRRTGRAALSVLGEDAPRLAPDASVWSLVHSSGGDGWEVVAARAGRHVAVHGAGRLGTTLATTLAAAGIGHISVVDAQPVTAADVAPAGARTADVGLPRAEAAALAVERAGGNRHPHAALRRPDVAVLIDHSAADAARADALVRTDVPHLSVVVREDDVVIGPLVRPGRGPCLRCLDLHRSDRDPAWPTLLAQLQAAGRHPAEPEETAVITLASGLAALQVLGQLDTEPDQGTEAGPGPASLGATLEIELPDGLVGRREWSPHHRCGCTWPARRPATGRARAGAVRQRE